MYRPAMAVPDCCGTESSRPTPLRRGVSTPRAKQLVIDALRNAHSPFAWFISLDPFLAELAGSREPL